MLADAHFGADLALTLAWVVVAVFRRERMPSFAVRFPCVRARKPVAEKCVFSGGESRQMGGVAAPLVLTKVVNLIVQWYRSVLKYVGHTMRLVGLSTFQLEAPVSLRVGTCLPRPAFAVVTELYVPPKTFRGRSARHPERFSRHDIAVDTKPLVVPLAKPLCSSGSFATVHCALRCFGSWCPAAFFWVAVAFGSRFVRRTHTAASCGVVALRNLASSPIGFRQLAAVVGIAVSLDPVVVARADTSGDYWSVTALDAAFPVHVSIIPREVTCGF